jgi:hypothetical protein
VALFARTPDRGRKRCEPRPVPQRLQPIKRGQHRLAVVHVARQAALAEGLTEVTGVRGEHDLAGVEPQPKRLVPRRVPVCRQTHHRAIAKHVMLTIYEPQFMADIKIAAVEPTPSGRSISLRLLRWSGAKPPPGGFCMPGGHSFMERCEKPRTGRWTYKSCVSFCLPEIPSREIKYFTALVSARPNDPNHTVRQQVYLRFRLIGAHQNRA